MSRSYRKTPITSFSSGISEKFDKQKYNRILRRENKERLRNGGDDYFLIVEEVSDIWSMNKDGKRWFGNLPFFRPSWQDDPVFWLAHFKELMRK